MIVTIIGRGHSGTRAMSHTLTESGVYMGAHLNVSGDLLPPGDLYEACRVMAKYVAHTGGLTWDFSKLHDMPIPHEFTQLVESYLASVLNSDSENRGWKLPETTLVYPWIIRMFPDIKYIHWVRDPRDSILGRHLTDDLVDFGIPYDNTDDLLMKRAISWKYQREIMKATPAPQNVLEVRFEDFVLNQKNTLARLEEFLGIELAQIEVRPDAVGRWCTDDSWKPVSYIFEDDLAELGYEK
ncbi:MAG: sulfotransferase family protein [Armatimonadota bacterium]